MSKYQAIVRTDVEQIVLIGGGNHDRPDALNLISTEQGLSGTAPVTLPLNQSIRIYS
jgi:hypothetical protein